MTLLHKKLTALTVVIGLVSLMMAAQATEDDKNTTDIPKPALTVTTASPQIVRLEQTLHANGNILAWQEAIIGNETDSLRLSEVKVNVGDQVNSGQLLAKFAAETLEAELARILAATEEAKAHLAEATKNAQRARAAKISGGWSEQEINRYLTEEQTAKAKLDAQQATFKLQQIRINQTRILASDSGVISSRSATVGAVLPKGQELFRLIRQNRLEWRAEVPSAELTQLKQGDVAIITSPSGSDIEGKVRMIAPSVDQQTRLGLVYVDLPRHPELKTGMFAKGKFELGSSNALTVPQQAVVMRDGFSYVFKLDQDNRVSQVKVKIGRRSGDRLEVLEGLQTNYELVTSGAGFLNEGDLVKVVSSLSATQNGSTKPNS